MAKFIPLHNHSHYSLLEGLSKIKDMVNLAKKYKMPALALTDHGNMYGTIEFYKTCKKEDIKPIIGVDAYITPGSRHDKRSRIDVVRYGLVLLAKNEIGYKNLIKLVTISNTEGFYYKPRMDFDLLEKYSEGLICLSGDFRSELFKALAANDLDEGRKIIKKHQDVFGKDNYFLEVMHHPNIEGSKVVYKHMQKLSEELSVPMVAAQGSYYLHHDDKEAHNTMLAIQNNISRGQNMIIKSSDFSFINQKQAKEFFADFPGALENTEKIADMCNLELELGNWVFPDVKIPEGSTYEEELIKRIEKGLKTRGVEKTKEVSDRIALELDTINKKGYAPYFLAVSDILNHAKEMGILTTTRGSAAGSMVSYLTGITNVDPIEYLLPFERFLNPFRPSAPDVDMDFADNRRDEIIEYARKEYGQDHVAQIGTFGTMLARGVVRDVARALGHPYSLGDQIAKLIPMGSQGFPMSIDRAFKEEPDLKKLYDSDEDVREVIDLGKKIEGCARHISVHAAGVVISPKPLTEYVPTQLDPKGGKTITQYDMHAVEDAGLLKFDFLGIKNLAILADSVERVKKTRDIDIDIENIPMDDKKTFEMLARGETMGLFQLNGAGMTRFLKDLRPSTIHDINAMVALYRPGPMNNIEDYIARKHGKQKITYYHPKMESFLDKSYGILVYQDDLLFTALNLAGYNWESVDKFRKAVGKKIPEEMARQHKIFVKGCMEHSGMTEQEAEGLWDLFEPFQGYGFNKAHAACYGRVAYQTAYMKANYPAEYMTAVLTADAGDVEKISEFVDECKRMGFDVLPPDINESFSDFTVVVNENGDVTDKIRFGLRSIKNFGEEIGKAIINERKNGGKYETYNQFLERVKHKNLNKKSLESLIMCGAMDSLGERGQLLANLDEALTYNKEIAKDNSGQSSLFGLMKDKESVPTFKLKKAEEALMDDKLKWEKELLGLYVSGHPLEKFKEKFLKHDQVLEKVQTFDDGTPVVIAGILDEIKTILTKKGTKMAFCKISDLTGSMEAVIFPETFEKNHDKLEPQNCVAIKGTVSRRNGEPSIIADKIKILE